MFHNSSSVLTTAYRLDRVTFNHILTSMVKNNRKLFSAYATKTTKEKRKTNEGKTCSGEAYEQKSFICLLRVKFCAMWEEK